MGADDNATVVRNFFNTLLGDKSTDALRWLADDVVLSGVKTKKELQDLLERGGEELRKILNLKLLNVIAQDDWIVVEAQLVDQFITAGDAFINEYLFLLQVDGQQIQEMREYRRTVNNKREDSWIWPWPWPWPRLIETRKIDIQSVYAFIQQHGGEASMIWPWPWPWPPR
ncbi:MAG TPA: hypothetical protein VNN62_11925 [Methylomirabilota bacterium]|jgi:ketosteroid isomerase-like protein|nr:hypothetical protein [Methylomirabilota bacterium]